MLVATVTPLQSRNELMHWDNRPFCNTWSDSQHKKPTGVTKPLKKKSRRIRTAYTTEQLRALEKSFTESRYIDAETRRELARSLKLGEKCIKIWFQNRRMKEKRDSSESSSDVSSENFAVETTEVTSPVVSIEEEQVLNLHQDFSSVANNQEKLVYCQDAELPVLNDQQFITPQNLEYQFNYAAIQEQTSYQMNYYNNMYPTEYYPNYTQNCYAYDEKYFQNASCANVGNSNSYWCADNYYYCYN